MTEQTSGMREPLLAALGAEAIKLRQAAEEATAAVGQETVDTLRAIEERGRLDRAAFFRRNLLVLAVQLLVVVLLLVLGLWNRATLGAVRSCTEPSGTCAQRAAAGQLVALEAIVFCDRRLPPGASAADVSTCISGALADFQETP